MSGAMNNLLEKLHLTKQKDEGAPPKEPSRNDVQELRERYEKAEQDHVLKYYDELDVAGKAALYAQLSDIDPQHINEIGRTALKLDEKKESKGEKKESGGDGEEKDEDENTDKPQLEPLPASAWASLLDAKEEDVQEWNDSGLALVADNKVAVVLMAGGQGTRLGSSAPKGSYNIGLPSGKSLFRLQAERIIKVQELAAHKSGKEKATVPWYIMTSGPTRKATQEFFDQHKYFGLDKADVVIFEQGVLPCISEQGKILLEDKSKVAVAPDGNGGLYMALYLSSIVSDMGKRGIGHIHAYCVDNCLAKVADPVFIGFSASKSVDIATKVVRKRNAQEPVGLIVQKNGRPDVVEYSEIDRETAEAKDSSDSALLKFRAANIVNHYYSYSFLESIPLWASKLPHHVARKKIPCMDLDKDKLVKPEKPNGVKLEQFVFDCFSFLEMDKFACMEVKREDEFSPLKNGEGASDDNPATSRRDVLQQGKRWVEAEGAVVTGPPDADGVEVSPLISYAGEGLQFLSKQTIKAPAVIERDAVGEEKKK